MSSNMMPKHIAIIMDGNGRWATQQSLPRIAGHKAGVESAQKIVKYCAKKGVTVLSLFAFSSENWRRPADEVNFIMELLLASLEHQAHMLSENNIKLKFIGDRSKFTPQLCHKINEVESLTTQNTGMTLIIAADYGGQWDICSAVKQLAQDIEKGKLSSLDITPQSIANKLSFANLPDPDLFIRTSGELRISNFMLWQLAYSELYFTNILWPDFSEHELEKALAHFATRERRYGSNSRVN